MKRNQRWQRELGARIFSRRRDLALTQKALADACCVAANTVARWERGELEPMASSVAALAVALDVSADWLLGVDRVT